MQDDTSCKIIQEERIGLFLVDRKSLYVTHFFCECRCHQAWMFYTWLRLFVSSGQCFLVLSVFYASCRVMGTHVSEPMKFAFWCDHGAMCGAFNASVTLAHCTSTPRLRPRWATCIWSCGNNQTQTVARLWPQSFWEFQYQMYQRLATQLRLNARGFETCFHQENTYFPPRISKTFVPVTCLQIFHLTRQVASRISRCSTILLIPSNEDMGVSENSGTPKSSILIGFSILNHPIWGTPIFGNTHIIILDTCSICGLKNQVVSGHWCGAL